MPRFKGNTSHHLEIINFADLPYLNDGMVWNSTSHYIENWTWLIFYKKYCLCQRKWYCWVKTDLSSRTHLIKPIDIEAASLSCHELFSGSIYIKALSSKANKSSLFTFKTFNYHPETILLKQVRRIFIKANDFKGIWSWLSSETIHLKKMPLLKG